MNEKLIKIAHAVAVMLLALGGVAFTTWQTSGAQNTNQSGNANRGSMQGNANSGNMNSGNTNSGNTNSGNANGNMGGQSGAGGQMGGGALSSNDRNFVMTAAMSGMAEVEMGRMAVERGASDAVKQFGQRMIDDHTRTNSELMQITSTLGVTPPAALDARHRAASAKLARLSGPAFDRAYAKQMVDDHQKAVSLFQRESERGANPELKSFAARTLPALREHLEMARGLSQATRNNNNSGGNTNRSTGGNANGNTNGNMNNR